MNKTFDHFSLPALPAMSTPHISSKRPSFSRWTKRDEPDGFLNPNYKSSDYWEVPRMGLQVPFAPYLLVLFSFLIVYNYLLYPAIYLDRDLDQ